MNRTPWTVDEELSRLKAEIQEHQAEGSPAWRAGSNEDRPRQQIQGHHNVQVAGDLTVHARSAVDPNHPEAIPCPQCRALTYRRSDWCVECNFHLRNHRIERARKEKRRRLTHMMGCCGIPGLLINLRGNKVLCWSRNAVFLGVGGGLLAATGLAALRRAQI